MRYFLISCFLLLVFSVSGQKYSNEFLTIGAGARGQAMGNAQVANVGDVTAGFWNPAGLLGVKSDLQVGVMHSEWFAGIGKYDYLSAAMPFENGKRAAGFSFIRFGVDNIPNTLSLYEDDGSINYDNITPFSAADYAFIFSYAQKLGNTGLALGGNAKVVHRTIGPFATSWGFGLDVGLQYRKNGLLLGALAKDISTTFNAWKFNFTDKEKETLQLTGNEIPISSVEITNPRLILGVGYGKEFTIASPKGAERQLRLTGELDFEITTDGQRNSVISSNPFSIDPYAGLEVGLQLGRVRQNFGGEDVFQDFYVLLRGGANGLQKELDFNNKASWIVKPNIGVGLQLGPFQLDYALTNVSDLSGSFYSHVISFVLNNDFKWWNRQFKANAN